jgi:hypothetical protein
VFEDIEDSDMKITKSVRREYKYPISLSDIEDPYKFVTSPLIQFFENNWPLCSIAFNLSKLKEIQIDPSIEFLEDWNIIIKMLEAGNKFMIGNDYTFIYNSSGLSQKKIEMDKSKAKNFSKKIITKSIEKYKEGISTRQFIEEVVDTGFIWLEQINLFGEVGDAYRRESEFFKKQIFNLQNEKLYKVLFAIRKFKNSLVKLFGIR